MKLDYPQHKLSVTVVDDCSTDDSYAHACRARDEYPYMVTVLKNPHNMGKRRGINYAVREATSEIIVSVDSDVIVYPTALRELVAWFTEPEVAAVGGRVHVSNPNDNWLSKLQTVKYFFGQEHLKNLERACETVLCLSGCLTAYRRSVLMEVEPILEDRNVLGVEIKYGEDRFLTHQIVKAGYKTRQTMDAWCFTKAPTTLRGYFNQQLRWKRSNIVDYIQVGIGDAWRMHPLVCLNYLSMLLLLLVYPLIIATHIAQHQFMPLATLHLEIVALFGLIYYFSPTVRKSPWPWLRVNPLSFLPMAILMPVAYLCLRRSASGRPTARRGRPAATAARRRHPCASASPRASPRRAPGSARRRRARSRARRARSSPRRCRCARRSARAGRVRRPAACPATRPCRRSSR